MSKSKIQLEYELKFIMMELNRYLNSTGDSKEKSLRHLTVLRDQYFKGN
jgi:hypothetical protein